MRLRHEFVEYMPKEIENGVLYVSISFRTIVHKCACGCEEEVVTPLAPTEWSMCYDGETISLDPSVGNWSFPCRSHYWIENNHVRWAKAFSAREIMEVRTRVRVRRRRHYAQREMGESVGGDRRQPFGAWLRHLLKSVTGRGK